MVERQEKFLNSRRSSMAKTVTFWTLVSLTSFCIEAFFFPFVSFFSFATQKSGGGGVGGGHGPQIPGVASPLT